MHPAEGYEADDTFERFQAPDDILFHRCSLQVHADTIFQDKAPEWFDHDQRVLC